MYEDRRINPCREIIAEDGLLPLQNWPDGPGSPLPVNPAALLWGRFVSRFSHDRHMIQFQVLQ